MAPPSLSMSISTPFSSRSFSSSESDSPEKNLAVSMARSDLSINSASAPGAAEPGGLPKSTRGDSRKGLLSNEEILRRRNEGQALIVVDGNVYDVTEFLETHPGGSELIQEHLGLDSKDDAGPLMRGKVDEGDHSHSKAAFSMLEQFFIGFVKVFPGAAQTEASAGKKICYTVDLTKPIVAQVGHLGKDYDQWVHDPIISKASPRFFESDYHEFFTRTKWWVIPLFWIPVAMAMFYMAIAVENVPLYKLPGQCVLGVTTWTFLEYLLHRCLFHMKTSSYWGNTAHYMLHGFHHKHPMDGARLVFPPAFGMVFGIALWFLAGNWIPFADYPNKLSVYAAALLAYVAYDVTHYFLHFGTAFNNESRKMKRYHLNHHFKDQRNGYGITTTLWDSVFGTLPATKLSLD